MKPAAWRARHTLATGAYHAFLEPAPARARWLEGVGRDSEQQAAARCQCERRHENMWPLCCVTARDRFRIVV
jgi:hypothetical protein